MPSRVADYFVVCGLDPDQDFPGSEAWENAQGGGVKLKSAVLDRVPAGDHKDAEFPQNLDMFCFPIGLQVESSMPQDQVIKFSFVLTEVSGTQLFCTALTFYEQQRISSGGGDSKTGGHLVFVPKCLCLVSHWPFFKQFNVFMEYVHKVFRNSSKTASRLPLERILANFMFETPFPPRGRIAVEVLLNEDGSRTKMEKAMFRRPAPNKLPLRDFSLVHLFRLLSVENIVLVFSCMLNERRVLFVSNRIEDLCIAAESFKSLLFPMIWRHIYVPVVPEPLLERVCAPFPYIMGVLESCMPDEKLLDGVIQVDLHNNKVSQYRGGDQINHLTDRLQSRLIKGLKKVVPDTSEPLGPGFIDEKGMEKYEGEVEQVFLRFFVKLFRSYKKYVEAPSEEVVEKFKKEEFLNEHGDKCEWLREVMETQMFQCFVDERYEYSTKTDNLEVLFFDEWIDKLDGNTSAFLSDTSQDHSDENVELAMLPNREGLEVGKRWTYLTFPKLDPNLMLPVRKPKKLITEAEEERENADRRIDMSKMAMKFFKEKRLYSQHFHSLSLHSRKQNIFFNSLVKYFKAAQAHEERFAKAQLSLYKHTLGTFKFYSTSTTIDDVWVALKNHIRIIAEGEVSGVKEVGNRCCQDLYTMAFQKENSIDLLLLEAEQLEKKTGRGKNKLETAKERAAQSKSSFEKMRHTLMSHGGGGERTLLTQGQITRLISSQCSMEDAALYKVEAATDFRTVLAAYEGRMPRIVNTIRNDNIERIEQLRVSMTAYLEVKRKALEAQMATLEKMEKAVAAVDTKRDMELFMQGTTDFWHVDGKNAKADGKTSDPAAQAHQLLAPSSTSQERKALVDTAELQVPDNNMDTSSGFDESSPMVAPPSLQPTSRDSSPAPPPPLPVREGDAKRTNPPALVINADRGVAPPPAKSPVPSPGVRPPPLPSANAPPGRSPPPLPTNSTGSPPPPVPPKKAPPRIRTPSFGGPPALPPKMHHQTRSSRASSFASHQAETKRNREDDHDDTSETSNRRSLGVELSLDMASVSTEDIPASPNSLQPRRDPSRPARTRERSSPVRDMRMFCPRPPTNPPPRGLRHRGESMAPIRARTVSPVSSEARKQKYNSMMTHSDFLRSGTNNRKLPPSPAGIQRLSQRMKSTTSRSGVITATQDYNTLGSLSYTCSLWGNVGFNTAKERSQASKTSIKKLTTMLEEWAEIVKQVGRKVESSYRSTPARISQETSMLELWKTMRNLARSKYVEYYPPDDGKGSGLSTKISALAQGLRVSKGTVKRSTLRYQVLRDKLIQEVEDAKAKRNIADGELKTAEAKFSAVCSEQARTEKAAEASQVTLDRVWLKVDQAKKVKIKREHHLMYCDNELKAITRKHDFVTARMQSLFEMKERESQSKLKHTLKFLATQCELALHGIRHSTVEILGAAQKLDFKADLKEFLGSVMVSKSASHKRVELSSYAMSSSEHPTLAGVLGLRGFDRAIAYANRNIVATKSMESALETAAEAQEYEIKLMRKWLSTYAKRSSTGVIFRVHDGYSLIPAFNTLARVVEEWIKYMSSLHEQYIRFERGLHSLRTELKAHVKFQQKQHEGERKAYEQSKAERDKAERDLKRARSEREAAVEKHANAQKAADRGEAPKKSMFGRWGKEDIHKLKSKMDLKIKEYNKCVDTLKRKKDALERATQVLEQRTKKQLDQMEANEKKRSETIQQLASAFAEEHAKRLEHLLSVLNDAYKAADTCDLHDNIQRFLKKNQVTAKPPEYVMEDYHRNFGYYFHVEPITPSDIRGIIWL
mmetsp:Transcript_7135/g.13649  ORF Transcript_7135/g.13649 Transcript_7135/m.13649 type:complete len:1782 (-) Transcript_7135:286-5631(-)